MDTQAIFELLSAHAWIPLAAMMIGAVVRLLKADVTSIMGVPIPTVPARYRPIAALVLGQVAAALTAIAAGTPMADAIVGGILASALAMAGHDVGIESGMNGKELGAK